MYIIVLFFYFEYNDTLFCLVFLVVFFAVITASPVSGKMGPAGSVTGSPKPFNPGLVPKQERTSGTGGILNLNLGNSNSTNV